MIFRYTPDMMTIFNTVFRKGLNFKNSFFTLTLKHLTWIEGTDQLTCLVLVASEDATSI